MVYVPGQCVDDPRALLPIGRFVFPLTDYFFLRTCSIIINFSVYLIWFEFIHINQYIVTLSCLYRFIFLQITDCSQSPFSSAMIHVVQKLDFVGLALHEATMFVSNIC